MYRPPSAQGISVDVVDGLVERVHVEQLALDCLCVLLETGVGAEASAGGTPELTANSLLLSDNMPDALGNEIMVDLVVRLRRGVRSALGG